MAIIRLFDNNNTAPVENGGFTVSFELGQRWQTSAAIGITHLRWKPGNTNAGDKPSAIRIWDTVTQSIVVTAPSVPHDGTTNWQQVALASPWFPTVDRQYIVSFGIPVGAHFASHGGANWTPPSPLSHPSNVGRQTGNNGIGQFPGNASSTTWYVDFVADTTLVPAVISPGDPVDVDAALDNWLSNDPEVQTHETDGLPWLTKAQLNEVKTIVDQIKAIADNIPQADDSPWEIVQKLWQIAGNLTEAEIAAWNLFAKRAPTQLTGASGGGGSAFEALADQIATLPSVPGATEAQVQAIVSALRELLTFYPAVETDPRWVLADTVSGEGNGIVSVSADLYRLTWTSIPPKQPQHDLGGGVIWTPHIGWYAPLRDTFATDRKFLEFAKQLITWENKWMGGLAIYSFNPTAEWAVECFVLDRA